MLATPPVDVAPLECEMRPYALVLYADAAKKRPVKLPPGAAWRKCTAPGEGSQVLTKPDNGGTEMCVFYELGVDAKDPEVQTTPQKTGVAKSLPDKRCPAIDSGRQSYPGKEWFFLSDNLPLPNAFKVKAKVETDGLAFLKAEKTLEANPGNGVGDAQLNVYAISVAGALECRKNASFFQGRYAACYRAQYYNKSVGRGGALIIALTKKGEYRFIESVRSAAGAPAAR